MNLAAVATAAGVAFALGRLTRRSEVVAARREASTDALTCLSNQAELMRQLHNRARRHIPYALFFIDLNGFKPINDTYGHDAGNELLAALGGRLRHTYPNHLTARYGGDEFVVVLDGERRRDHISAFAEGLRRTVEQAIDLRTVPERVKISAAIGLACARPGDPPECTLQAADQDMYRSKTGPGRPGQLRRYRDWTATDETPKSCIWDGRTVRVA